MASNYYLFLFSLTWLLFCQIDHSQSRKHILHSWSKYYQIATLCHVIHILSLLVYSISLNSSLEDDTSPFVIQREHLRERKTEQRQSVVLSLKVHNIKVRSQPEWSKVFFVRSLELPFYQPPKVDACGRQERIICGRMREEKYSDCWGTFLFVIVLKAENGCCCGQQLTCQWNYTQKLVVGLLGHFKSGHTG